MRQVKAPGKIIEELNKKIVAIVDSVLDEIKLRSKKTVLKYAQKLDGWQAHARACGWCLRKYYPGEQWDFEIYDQTR